MIGEIQSFFEEISSKDNQELDIARMAYIAINEWHWSEEQFWSCSIPFFFMLLEERAKDIKKQNDEIKKARRK